MQRTFAVIVMLAVSAPVTAQERPSLSCFRLPSPRFTTP